MKNKTVKALAMMMTMCMLGNSTAGAEEFSSGPSTAEDAVVSEAAAANTESADADQAAATLTDGDSSETDTFSAQEEEPVFSDSDQQEEFSDNEELPDAEDAESLAGAVTAAAGSSNSVVEADIATDPNVKTTCTSYNGTNLEKQDYETYGDTVKSYLTAVSGGMMRVQAGAIEGKVLAEYYDSSYNYQKTVTIPLAYPLFGGFYESADNYYLLTGQENPEEDNTKIVYCVTKYTKDWKSMGSCGVSDFVTKVPFDAGSARMTMSGQYLFVRSCHKRRDGHQENISFSVDTSSMTKVDSIMGAWNPSAGHVSHSFNQFIQVDNGTLLGADHGDYSPRALTILKYTTDISAGKFVPGYTSGTNLCKEIDMVKFSGYGNYTGASLGAFEYSSSSYLMAGNMDSAGENSSRNVFVASVSKDGGTPEIKYFTSYSGSDSAATPHLIKTGSDSFVLMWSNRGTVYYTALDGAGNQVGSTYSMTGNLSDCKPAIINGKLIWYTWHDNATVFYDVNLSDLSQNHAVKIVNGHDYTYGEPDKGWVNKICTKCGQNFGKAKVPSSVKNLKYKRDTSNFYYNDMYSEWEIKSGAVYDLHWNMGYSDSTEGVETAGESEVTVSDPDIMSVKMTDDTTARVTAKKSGYVTLTISAKCNSDAKRTIKVYVDTEAFSDKWFSVTMTPDEFTFDRDEEQQTPDIVVCKGYDGETLMEGRDYKVTYSGSLHNAGTVDVMITGQGTYVGTIKRSYKINKKPFKNCKVTILEPNLVYIGREQKPTVLVVDGHGGLEEGVDYTLKYENNIERGIATASVTGMGNYESTTIRKEFTISNPRMGLCGISLSKYKYIYDGKEKKPEVTVLYQNQALKEGVDYTVQYSDNINVGTAKVTVIGKGGYSGEDTTLFEIQAPAEDKKDTEDNNQNSTGDKNDTGNKDNTGDKNNTENKGDTEEKDNTGNNGDSGNKHHFTTFS